MKKTVLIMRMFFLGLLFISAVACSSDDDGDNGNGGGEDQKNIVEIALETPELANLVAALQAADGDLVNVLQGPGPFTVLAPNNAAFTKFLSDNGFGGVNDVPSDVLEAILLNHVIGADVTSGDLTNLGKGYTNTSASGANNLPISLYFNTENGVRFNNVSAVTSGGADIDASNGTIHIVDAVIPIPNIVDHAAANADFSSLVAALGAADGNLVDVLNGEGPFTVLAPDNDAFTTFLDGADLGGINKTVLTRTLLNHVVGDNVSASDLTGLGAGYTKTSVDGPGDNPMSLYFNTSSGVQFNGTSTVTTADVVGSNGIIHAVDAVIALPTVVTFAAADPNFTTLAGALTDRGFVSILSRTEGDNLDNINPDFTVFAPTNEAFDALESIPEGTALDNVLLHHVISEANLSSSALAEGENPPVTTLQGQDVTVTVIGGNPILVQDGSGTENGIIAFDVQADNGVIHVVDSVLIPADQ